MWIMYQAIIWKVTKIRNERGDITTELTEIKGMREYCNNRMPTN